MGYDLADTIAISARHVEASFLGHGANAAKLFRNPCGVDFQPFQQDVNCDSHAVPSVDFITKKTMSLRKVSDLLAHVVPKEFGFTLLHVRAVGDSLLSQYPHF